MNTAARPDSRCHSMSEEQEEGEQMMDLESASRISTKNELAPSRQLTTMQKPRSWRIR